MIIQGVFLFKLSKHGNDKMAKMENSKMANTIHLQAPQWQFVKMATLKQLYSILNFSRKDTNLQVVRVSIIILDLATLVFI